MRGPVWLGRWALGPFGSRPYRWRLVLRQGRDMIAFSRWGGPPVWLYGFRFLWTPRPAHWRRPAEGNLWIGQRGRRLAVLPEPEVWALRLRQGEWEQVAILHGRGLFIDLPRPGSVDVEVRHTREAGDERPSQGRPHRPPRFLG
ncbi:protein of unknown function [Candidatus Hydrogenisulfobacillus filiaventi]|uniref:Uncharacterized protein n=1 Tax=Candidatus Hydrogenisulfobacillus filiaventi TaxID=2707344 RepID=A0A6F8ZJ55_9FIRM|nr:protein of unknown function [Candidatus Hydrogenisulfobacillus filiaventi]